MPHTIRLRGPWEFTPLARFVLADDGQVTEVSKDLPAADRMQMPDDWGRSLGTSFRGRVRYERHFGRPTNLASGDRVCLVVEAVDSHAAVALNGQILGEFDASSGPANFEVAPLLKERNVLTIEVELSPCPAEREAELRGPRAEMPGGLVGEVRLEIWPANE